MRSIHRISVAFVAVVALAVIAAACNSGMPGASPTPTPEPKVELPPAPPIPPGAAILGDLPAPVAAAGTAGTVTQNTLTPEKAQLGWMLFFDKRLSKDGSMACAECHHTDKAYTDGRDKSPKVGGGMNKRNAMGMLNLGYHQKGWYWDGRAGTMEGVSAAAWKGQLGADPAVSAAALNAIPAYKAHFQRAFGADATAENVPMALASFLRALKSTDSAFDKYEKGDKKAVSADAVAGFALFKNKGCTLCHVPPLYSDADFHNTGIGMEAPEASRDHGRMDASKDPKDDGKFKTPSLRDVALTGPYFHDGSVTSLDEAIKLMAKGGMKNKNLDPKLKPQKMTAKELAQVKAFLESLSGGATFPAAPELP